MRLNVLIPEETVKNIKRITPKRGLSRFLAEAASEKIKRIEREKALRELIAMPPTFTHVKDSRKWIREIRRRDLKRMKRLGI
ncbi:MAG: hypothetical protein HY427_00830 [Candidatus Levybacteria bacterium]|nr:hypothetical protein [Candidatus Levybacteria bacterium]